MLPRTSDFIQQIKLFFLSLYDIAKLEIFWNSTNKQQLSSY